MKRVKPTPLPTPEEFLASMNAKAQDRIMWSLGIQLSDGPYRHTVTGVSYTELRDKLRATGGDSISFWRGIAEGANLVMQIHPSRQHRWPVPYVYLTGSTQYLAILVEWMYEKFPTWDIKNSTLRCCRRRRIQMTNSIAKVFIDNLFPNEDVVCFEHNRVMLREFKGWIPKSGTKDCQVRSTLIDPHLLDASVKKFVRKNYTLDLQYLGLVRTIQE